MTKDEKHYIIKTANMFGESYDEFTKKLEQYPDNKDYQEIANMCFYKWMAIRVLGVGLGIGINNFKPIYKGD